MAIQKQEYYEGAALHSLIRRSGEVHIRYSHPFFVLNGCQRAYVKYSTRGRSPWGFTFTPDECDILSRQIDGEPVIVALVCGSDGVASVRLELILESRGSENGPFRVSCYRDHKKHYRLKGPLGWLESAVAPSSWERTLESRST